jgi:MFS transporter, NNP family, nitrate/nitrite transporter
MQETATFQSHKTLFFNTFAFTACFAVWMLNGVLVTFLAANQVYDWGPVEIGWLMGIPVLTGAIFRLPAGILTDKFGGKPIYTALLFVCAIPMYLLTYADSFWFFAACSFGFGLAGASFSIGIAFTSVWYPRDKQGMALGIFGAGNAGAAITTLFAPTMLNNLTDNGTNIEGWRELPVMYAGLLVVMGVIFLLFTKNKKPATHNKKVSEMLRPLKDIRVWRFGLYYFLVFGCFVAFSQWLVPYFVNVYYMPLVTAGILAALFSFPSGVIRAFGGWMSDKWGARKVMYWVLISSVIISMALSVPKMEVFSTGQGVMAKASGTVTSVSENAITVDKRIYPLKAKTQGFEDLDELMLVFPTKEIWQEGVVKVGQEIKKKELLAKGVTRIYFQANVWIFAVMVIIMGSIWGIGKAAVYKHIPDYYPEEVGVVGGMVGVLGGLGGFVCPIIFGYLLEWTGLWTSAWMFMFVVSFICLAWMHRTIMKQIELPFDLESKFSGLLRAGGDSILAPLLSWNQKFSVGIDEIDNQHKHMMDLLNKIDDEVQASGNPELFSPLVTDLIEYTKTHFAFEEKLLEKNDCPEFEPHRKNHQQLLTELIDWQQKAENCSAEKLKELMVILRLWFPGHILNADKKHAQYLQ